MMVPDHGVSYRVELRMHDVTKHCSQRPITNVKHHANNPKSRTLEDEHETRELNNTAFLPV